MDDIKGKTVSGALAKVAGQAANFVLRLGSTVILARLLDPKDFGLVAMATVVTGFYGIFTSAGLSSATVQRATVTDEQISTLFWINIVVGSALGLLCVATAPLLVRYYHEPRLFWITVALGGGFLFSATAVQHTALLQRQMRFLPLTLIDSFSSFIGIVVGIAMAWYGLGYWAVVGMALSCTASSAICKWVVTSWTPGWPSRNAGIRSMLVFGGTVTLNGVLVYLAYNTEKVLLGRFWGADALGLYNRAYNLINIPTENINVTVSGLAFSALSRVQHDTALLKNYFLKGYSLLISMTLPISIVFAFFADDLVLVLLGPKWREAAVIFRLLTPTVLVFAMINPLGWLLQATGLQARSLKLGVVISILIISAVVIGLPFGPRGVAFAYSAILVVWVVPHIAWAIHGTSISLEDLLLAISRPFLSGVAAAVVALAFRFYLGHLLSPFLRLAMGGTVMAVAYLWMLLIVMGQKTFYLNLFRGLRRSSSSEETGAVSL